MRSQLLASGTLESLTYNSNTQPAKYIRNLSIPNINTFFEDQGQFYEFALADDDPGIAPEFHDKVFGIFQTLEARDQKRKYWCRRYCF